MEWNETGGGGFMNDSIADEPQQLSNSVSVGGEERSKTVASVSVSQISKLTRPNDGGLVIHGKKIYHVNLIAMIHEILDISVQKIHLMVDDYTSGGPLEVSHILGDTGVPDSDNNYSLFNDNEFESLTKSLHELKVGDYVRCVGVVKYTNDRPNVIAYYISYLSDPNEITKHILEVIRDSMQLERAQANGSSLPVTNKTNNYNQMNQGAQNQSKAVNNEFGRLSNREKLVLKFVRDRTDVMNDIGVLISEIASNLRAFKLDEIRTSLETLNAEGLCWQGDNEDMWFANNAD